MPNQIRSKPACDHQRNDDRGGQHHHRDAVEEAAEHDVEQRQHAEQAPGRHVVAADPFGQRARNAGEAHGGGEIGRAGQDEGDHAAGLGRAQQRIAKAVFGQRARPPRQRERQEHADHRRFGGRGQPAIDRADHAENEQRHRDQPARGVDARAERHVRLRRRHARLVEQRPDDDEAHEQAAPA